MSKIRVEIPMLPDLSEAQIKRAVEDYLVYQQNQGKLIYHRLNAGDFIIVEGEGRRRVKGQGKGCADFLVIQPWVMRYQKGSVVSPEYHTTRVTYIEIKTAKSKQSQEQLDFEQMVKGLRCRYEVVRSVEAVEEALERG